jgi:hypothetical protein
LGASARLAVALGVLGLAPGGRDVGLEPSSSLLLGLVGQRLLRTPSLALGTISAVAALVARQLAAVLEVEHAVHDRVEERAVVRDDHRGAVERAQPPLQPGQTVAVEVVGRLVEEHDGGPGQQRARQQRTRLLAPRQAGQRRAGVEVIDGQRPPRLVERGVQRPAAERAEAVLRAAVGLQRGRRGVAVAQACLERVQLAAHSPYLAQSRTEEGAERGCGGRCLLRQPTDAVGRARGHRAAVGPLDAGQQPQQGRLAHPVGPDEPRALAVGEHERQAVEQRRAVIRLHEIRCLQHGVLRWGSSRRARARRSGRECGRGPRPQSRRATARPSHTRSFRLAGR